MHSVCTLLSSIFFWLSAATFAFLLFFFCFLLFQKEELGRLLINISAVVPGGLVCFFSSYDYEQQVYTHWQKSGILDKMNARKKVCVSKILGTLFKVFYW